MTGLTLNQIIPPIDVSFQQAVANLISTGTKGIVAYCTHNPTQTDTVDVFIFKDTTSITGVDTTIQAQVTSIFAGNVDQVILFSYKTQFSDCNTLLQQNIFDWLVCDDATAQENVSLYGKENNIKTVVYAQAANDMHVVNFTNPSVLLADGVTTQTGVQYLPRIAGALAGLPYTEDACALTFTDLSSVTLPSDMELGQFILYNDPSGVKVASPVNSLTTLTVNVTSDMQQICIVEGMDRMSNDIKSAYAQSYKGKYKNKYDYQCLFISAVNQYFKTLADLEILDSSYNNVSGVDVDAQKALWIADGYNGTGGKDDASKWTDIQIKNNTYKNQVLLLNDVKFLEGMDALQFTVNMM